MKVFTTADAINQHLISLSSNGITIGFVPTMGALHEGHLSLIKQAKEQTDQVVCSIFVNPLQFNRKEDLENYPDRIKNDQKMLEEADCDILFLPAKEEVYPEKPDLNFNFGSIATGMEAKYRPNHFEGVAAVIDRFLKIIQPTIAFFGEKDFQQLAIIRWLVTERRYSTKIVGCPTLRYDNGLAMSSRNYLLSRKDLEIASRIHSILNYCRDNKQRYSPDILASMCKEKLELDFKPDYFEIVDEESMVPIKNWEENRNSRAFVAAYLSGVRLIDNLSLNT